MAAGLYVGQRQRRFGLTGRASKALGRRGRMIVSAAVMLSRRRLQSDCQGEIRSVVPENER